MIIKVIVYFIAVLTTTYGLKSTEMDPGTFAVSIPLLYIGAFLILLGVQIRGQLLRNAREKEVRKTAFLFSLGVGISLGLLTTFYRGYPTFYYSFEQTIGVIFGCIIGGFLIGILGVGVSYIIVPILRRWEERKR